MNLSNGILGEPNGVGNYLFCNNNPVDFVDPMGLKVFKDVVVDKGIDKYGLPIVCVQDMEYKWYYKNGISDRKPISDPKWRRAITNKDLGHFIHKNGEWKVSSRYYPTGALGAEIAEIDYDRAMKEGLIVLAASGAIGGGIAAAPFVYSACAPAVGTAKTVIVAKGTEAIAYGSAKGMEALAYAGSTATTISYYGQRGLARGGAMLVNGANQSSVYINELTLRSYCYYDRFIVNSRLGNFSIGISQNIMPYGVDISSVYYDAQSKFFYAGLYSLPTWKLLNKTIDSCSVIFDYKESYPNLDIRDTDIWQGDGRNTVYKVDF